MILFILPNISGRAACRTQTSGWNIRGYCFWWGVWWDSTQLDANFWDMFNLGQITQTFTCSICSSVTTRETPFSELLVQFPDTHHEATATILKCTLNSLIEHSRLWMPDLQQEDLSNKMHSNELLSHYLMHRTRMHDEWWNQNHFGSQISCNQL